MRPDTVYDLFAKGELPGRKVGRKWITTKAAVLRWIENTSGDDSLARAVERGDMGALTRAMNKGKVRDDQLVKNSRALCNEKCGSRWRHKTGVYR